MAYNIYLIRHGKTEGNIRRAYIGVSDQPICSQGISELIKIRDDQGYPLVDHVFVSPMLRCIQTMEIIYKNIPYSVVPELRECDFGLFEGKTHDELKDNSQYLQWIDNGSKGVFPAGENTERFKERCYQGFEKITAQVITDSIRNCALVIHGGTIMSILEKYAQDGLDFFHWQTENGSGYRLLIDKELWLTKKKILEVKKI